MIMMKTRLQYLTLLLVLHLHACTTTEVITANSKPAVQSYEQIPYELLMDVGILPLDPNLPDPEKNEGPKAVVTDVRNAESRFIAYHLKDTLELTGNWGAVRVLPEPSEAVDLQLSGKIITSDGEILKVRMLARDSTGHIWLDKEYRDICLLFHQRTGRNLSNICRD